MRITVIFLCCLLSSSANAQVESKSFWPLLNPDMWLQRFMHFGIVSARTQVDIKYQNLNTNVASGVVTLSGVELWPRPEWDDASECKITAARLSISGVPIDEVELLSLGVDIDRRCLPPDFGPAELILGAAGFDTLTVPKLRFEFDYNIPDGSLLVEGNFSVQDILSMSAAIDLSYVTVGQHRSRGPYPVAYLRNARIEIADQGLWSMIGPILPSELKDPTNVRLSVVNWLTQALSKTNGDKPDLSEAQKAFIDSVGISLSDFVVNPGRLVLESHLQGESILLSDEISDTHALFEQLAPKMARQSVVVKETVPVDLMQAAISGKYKALSDDDLSRVARAMVIGVGAPRNLEIGKLLALELAERGAVGSAVDAAELLQERDPVKAYELAVSAAKSGSMAATGLADRLEYKLSLAEVLSSQASISEGLAQDIDYNDISQLSDRAFAHLIGTRATRNYEQAAYWATLASAAGDLGGRAVLDEINTRVEIRIAEDRAIWAAKIQQIEAKASEIWLREDFPSLINEGM